MVKLFFLVVTLGLGAAAAQTLSGPGACAADSQGNQVCIDTQPDDHTCGYLGSNPFPGGGTPGPVYCRDVVIRKTTPGGDPLYTRVLGGESDESPWRVVIDPQGNAVVLGTTYSRQFPTLPDAVQPAYSGPAPPTAVTSDGLPPGGDLFLSILGPTGDLLYSMFLGSPENDTLLGLHVASNSEIDVLVDVGASGFPEVPARTPASPRGPVLFTFDTNAHNLVRSTYLPIAPPGRSAAFYANMRMDGGVIVITQTGLYTFRRDGQQRTFVSLDSFHFGDVPGATTDPAGDIWLVGAVDGLRWVVTKLVAGTAEAFRWTLPIGYHGGPFYNTYLSKTPFFGPDGLTYLSGSTLILRAYHTTTGELETTTPNALLQTPCIDNSYTGYVAVLDPNGDVKLLSYLPALPLSFAATPEGAVEAVLGDPANTHITLDLSDRPKAACVVDLLGRVNMGPPVFGVGQIVRLRGGGFGPQTPAAAALEDGVRFPTALNGLSVDVAGIPAPILSAAPGEVVFAIPFATPEGDSVPVTIADQGRPAAALPMAVRTAAPGLVEPLFNADGTLNWFDGPAAWGSTVTVYLTGAGPYSPPLGDGQVAPTDTAHGLQLPVSLSFLTTGPDPEPGVVLYAGPAPGFVGLTQVNIQLPPQRPVDSIVPLLTVNGLSASLPAIWVQ